MVKLKKCTKCNESYIQIIGGSICKCNNPKVYNAIKKSFEELFQDKEGNHERKRHTK